MCQSVTDMNLPWDKHIGLTTEEAPSICGEKSRPVEGLRAKMQEEKCPRESTQHITVSYTKNRCVLKS